MADQQLRMTALLANKVSGPLKQMQRDLAAFGKQGKALPQDFLAFEKRVISTQRQLGLLGKGSLSLRKEFVALGHGVGRLSPQVGGLTEEIIGLTAGTGTMIGTLVAGGAAMAGVTVEAKNFARSMRELKLQSRETGFSSMQLEQLRTAGQRWGITEQQITSDTESFALSLVKLQTNAENFRGQLTRLFPDTRLWAKMTTDAGKSSAAAFLDLLDAVDQIEKQFPGAGGVQRARVFLQQFASTRAGRRSAAQSFARSWRRSKLTRRLGPLRSRARPRSITRSTKRRGCWAG
jgi:hypothetical protein